jgi:hypothetical integral membrane protein (TIGR02206 family)
MPAPSLAPPYSTPIPWWSEFHSFTLQHIIALGWTLSLIVISCWLGRRWLRPPISPSDTRHPPSDISFPTSTHVKELQLSAAWAGFLIGVNLWTIFYWLQPEHFDLKRSLPLHICDIGLLLAPLLFLTRWRIVRSIIYFWGIGLCTQAFITPTLVEGIAHPRYWIFWLGHLAIIGSAIYDLIVRRYRPTLRDCLTTIAVTIVWYVAVGILNVQLGSNYGYNGNTRPDSPTLIDVLGPWPQRCFIMAAIVVVLFLVMWAVWPLARRLRARTADARIQ